MVKETIQEKKEEKLLWQPYNQPSLEGFMNSDGKFITMQDALAMILSYSEEAAKNTR